MKEVLDKGLMAMIPRHIDKKGSCTSLYVKDLDPIVIEKTTEAVLEDIEKYLKIDLKEIRSRYTQMILSNNIVPFALSDDDIFIAIKTRDQILSDDESLGYINIKYIKEMKKGKNESSTNITLANNVIIKCSTDLVTVSRSIINAHLIRKGYDLTDRQVAEEIVNNEGNISLKDDLVQACS